VAPAACMAWQARVTRSP